MTATLAIIQQTIVQMAIQYQQVTAAYDATMKWAPRNLKKYSVDQALKSPQFMTQVLPDYLGFLEADDGLQTFELLNLESAIDCRWRVKRLATAIIKMQYYTGKHRYVAKTLNDCFGGRLVLKHVNRHSAEIAQLLLMLKQVGYLSRYYYRQDGRYRAWHCYFQNNNTQFPWELQIWDTDDCQHNLAEHQRHEQERQP